MEEGWGKMEDHCTLQDCRGQVRGIGDSLTLEFLYQSSPNSSESLQLYTWKSK